MSLRLTVPLICGLLALSAARASAHTLLVDPEPRSDDDGLKTGPCGGVAPTGTPTELEAGSTITVRWLETIDHPGYFRIAFSRVGDTGFDDNVLLDEIPDVVCSAPPCEYSADVVLPDEVCEDCSLQIIQFMGTAPPYSPYFSCADIALLATPVTDAGPPPDAGSGPDAGDPPPDEGDAGIGADDPDPVGGGCAVGGGGGRAGLLIVLALVAVRRRERVEVDAPIEALEQREPHADLAAQLVGAAAVTTADDE